MKKWGIVTKMVVSACGLLVVLMSIGSTILIILEFRMLHEITTGYREKTLRSLAEQERSETENLHQNVRFNAQVLSEIAAVHLYNYDGEGIQQNLQTYMKYPDLVAIEIIDDFDEPFAVSWNEQAGVGELPEEELPITLPENFQRDAYFHFEAEAMLEEVQGPPWVGRVTRAAMVTFILGHNMDLYGQMVVYLRLEGVVPPASRR